MVEVSINGEYQVLSVNVAEIIIDKNEKEMLQVMIASAFNDASNKMKLMIEEFTKREAAKLGITQ
jgi:DNA-binding protein YbaB